MITDERQVSPTVDGIRKDHVFRYQFAAEYLKGATVIDCGCGVGYGTSILANECTKVTGYDVDTEAVSYAKKHYKTINNQFFTANMEKRKKGFTEAGAVCFEMLEHVKNPEKILKRLPDILIASVPNEAVYPYNDKVKYHYRHYTAQEFESLLNDSGYEVKQWYGQNGIDSNLVENTQGRTLIAVAHREKKPKTDKWKILPAVRPVPNSVSIVAMGMSAATYMRLCSNKGNRKRVSDETWAINSMGGVIKHDLLFHMDDCKIQEARAQRRENSNVAGMITWLKDHPNFMTSRKYDGYEGAIEFPLQDVINYLGVTYFNNTVAYAVAYAIYIGVKKIGIYGADYSYDNLHKSESGRGCVEFLLGIAAARGIDIKVAGDSTLLDANVPKDRRFYGYDSYDIELKQTDHGVEVIKNNREVLPSALEIEKRYKNE